METYFANIEELWQTIQHVGGVLIKDFALSHYGESTEQPSGYALIYQGPTHDIYKVNKTVELLYNKLVNSGLKNNVQLVNRKIHRPDKYGKAKVESIIELYPGLQVIEDQDTEEQ
jgi:hypothetical protein